MIQKSFGPKACNIIKKIFNKKIWCYYILPVFLSLFIFISISSYYLLGTTSGALWLYNKARELTNSSMDLQLDIKSGTLFTGLNIGKLKVDIKDVVLIRADHLNLKYKLSDILFLGALKVGVFDTSNLRVILYPTPPNEPKEQDTNGPEDNQEFRINFPIDIDIANAKVKNFAYLSDIVDVYVNDFSGQLQAHKQSASLLKSFNKNITVHLKNANSVDIDNINKIIGEYKKDNSSNTDASFQLISAPINDKAIEHLTIENDFYQINKQNFVADNTQGFENLTQNFDSYIKDSILTDENKLFLNKKTQISLPSVSLPLDVLLYDFNVKNCRYYQDSFDSSYVDLSLSATFNRTILNILNLNAYHALGAIKLQGMMNFQDHYYLDFILKGQGASSEYAKNSFDGLLYKLKGSANIKGDLSDLKMDAKLNNGDDSYVYSRIGPISKGIPIVSKIKADNLSWPIGDKKPIANIKRLNLNALGYLTEDLKTHADGLFTGYGFNDFSFKADTNVNFNRLKINEFDINGVYDKSDLNGSLTGIINYSDSLEGNAKLTLNSNSLGFAYSGFNGPVKLESAFNFKLYNKDQKAQYDLGINYLNGNLILNSKPLVIDLKNVYASTTKGFSAQRLFVQQDKNKLLIEGNVDTQNADIKGNFDISDLSLIDNKTFGSAKGVMIAQGNINDLKIKISGRVPFIRHQGFYLKNLVFDSNYANSNKDFSVTTIIESIKLARGFKPSKQCVLDLSGNIYKHEFTGNCSGTNSGFIDYVASYDKLNDKYKGKLLEFIVSNENNTLLALQNPVTLDYDLTYKEGLISPIILNSNEGTVKVSDTKLSQMGVKTNVNIKNLDLNILSDFYPQDTYIKGYLNGKTTIDVNAQKINIIGNLKANNSKVLYTGVLLNLKSLAIDFNVNNNNFNLKSALDLANNNGNININLNVLDPINTKGLSGSIKINDIKLNQFAALGSAFNTLDGSFNSDLKMSGNLSKPLIFGKVNLKGKAIPRYDIGEIEDFDLSINAKGSRGDIIGKVLVNGGSLDINGLLNWERLAGGYINVKSDNLPLFLAGYGQGVANLDLNAKFSDIIDITGYINMPKARIVAKNLTNSPISPSADEYIVSNSGTKGMFKNTSSSIPSTINVDLSIGNDVNIKAMGLDAMVVGKVNVYKGLDDKIILSQGKVSLEDGKIDLFGHHFIVNKADSIFDGDVTDPSLDVEVIADKADLEDDVDVGVMVTGKVSDPKVKLFSEPAMTDNEILSYILYGQGLEKSSSNQDTTNGALLLGLGLSSTTNLVNTVVGAFGVQNIQVGSQGSGDETKLSVQGYVTRKIRVSYGYGVFTSVSEFKLRYELARKLYAEFISSVDQAVDLIYRFEF